MDREENYTVKKDDIEEDNIVKSENLEVAAKYFNMKGFTWGMGIAYILSVYILICTIVVGGEMMDSIPLYLILLIFGSIFFKYLIYFLVTLHQYTGFSSKYFLSPYIFS